MDDLHEDNETITWFYDTDYEFLNGDNVEQIIVSGKRSKDTIVRLLMAGVPKEKIFADRDEVESVRKYFKPKDIESVYVLYDLYAMKQKEEVHQEVKKILEDTFGKKVEELKIEMLYPEVCNLFGDISNIKYLKKCLPDAEIIKTEINSEPAFVTQDVDMIYMGPMPENIQEVAIRKLRPYKEKIEELIKKNVVFLVTGNAVELFGKYIENEDGSKIEALSIFDIYAKRDMMHRHNSIFLGKYEDIEIVGFKSQFTMAYGDNENNYFVKAEKGIGLNKESKLEGIKQNNFIGTYLIGPILILNPLFTRN